MADVVKFRKALFAGYWDDLRNWIWPDCKGKYYIPNMSNPFLKWLYCELEPLLVL